MMRIKRRIKLLTYVEDDEKNIVKMFNLCLKYNLLNIINIFNKNKLINDCLYKLVNKNYNIKGNKILLFLENWPDNIMKISINNLIDLNDLDILVNQNKWDKILKIFTNSYRKIKYNKYNFKILSQYEIDYTIIKKL